MTEPRLPEKLQDLVGLIESVPDRADRIQLLIDIADRFPGVPARIAERPYPASHKTPACESEVYVFSEPLPDGTLRYHFAVENPQGISAKATAVVLAESLSGLPCHEVLRVPRDVVLRLFGRELSLGKGLGLMGMVAMVHHLTERAHV